MDRVVRLVKLRPLESSAAVEDVSWDAETVGVRAGSSAKDLKIKVERVLDSTVGSEHIATTHLSPLVAEVLAGVNGVLLSNYFLKLIVIILYLY